MASAPEYERRAIRMMRQNFQHISQQCVGQEQQMRPRRIQLHFSQMELDEESKETCCKKFLSCCWPLNKLIRCIKDRIRDPPPVQTSRRIIKHMTFISSPMANKSTRALPGIEETVSEDLADIGLLYAYQLFNYYLRMDRSSEDFVTWMMGQSRICLMDAYNCYCALEAYEETMMRKIRPDILCP